MKTKDLEKIFELDYATVAVTLWTMSHGNKAVFVQYEDLDGGVGQTWVHNFANMPSRWVEMIYHDLDDHTIEEFIDISNVREYVMYEDEYA